MVSNLVTITTNYFLYLKLVSISCFSCSDSSGTITKECNASFLTLISKWITRMCWSNINLYPIRMYKIISKVLSIRLKCDLCLLINHNQHSWKE